jgi:hypothetical protein
MTLKPKKPRLGRPPNGHNGALVSEYERITLRLPPEARALLDAWVVVVKKPAYMLITEAITEMVSALPGGQGHQVRRAARGRAAFQRYAAEKRKRRG